MALPSSVLGSTVIEPAVLAGHANGQLPASILVTFPMPGGGTCTLIEVSARAFRAMAAHAARDGILLCSTQGYRTLAQQIALLEQRYVVVTSGSYDIVWAGKKWRHVSGATVATPGRSNHGRGIAVDLSEQRDGDPEPESISQRAVDWLIVHARAYGITGELASEPWHWRYINGDNIPAVVLAYEAGNPFTPGGDMFALTQFGASGDDVRDLQWVLADMGYDLGSGGADGRYGDRTAEAVKAAVAPWVGGDPSGRTYGRGERFQLLQAYVRHLAVGKGEKGDPGPEGPRGPKGDPGDAAVLAPGARLIVEA